MEQNTSANSTGPRGWWLICLETLELHNSTEQDWLYGSVTARCGCGDERDNDPSTTFSKVFFLLIYAIAALAISVVSARSDRTLPTAQKAKGANSTAIDGSSASCVDRVAESNQGHASVPSVLGRSAGQASTTQPFTDAEGQSVVEAEGHNGSSLSAASSYGSGPRRSGGQSRSSVSHPLVCLGHLCNEYVDKEKQDSLESAAAARAAVEAAAAVAAEQQGLELVQARKEIIELERKFGNLADRSKDAEERVKHLEQRLSEVEDGKDLHTQPAAVMLPLENPTASAWSRGSAEIAAQPVRKERLWYVDYARIVCVACVVTEHSGGEVYADRNIAWVQQWVLPYLYTISGMSFMFSSGSVAAYLLRISIVFLVGTTANLIADIISGREWQTDFANTIFQMMYVAVIGVISVLLAPLRASIRWRVKNPEARATSHLIAWTAFWGIVTLVFLILMAADWSLARTVLGTKSLVDSGGRAFILYTPYVFATYFGIVFLCFLMCMLKPGGTGVWLILAVIYISRMVIPYSRGGHPLYADLFAVGMLSRLAPMLYGAGVAQSAREYWPLVFTILLLLSVPGVTGRCDLHPHYHVWERIRFYAIEWILVVLLLSGAFNTSDSKGLTGWLNAWALYAYCFHVCWARIFPQPSYGAIFTYAAAPCFFCLHSYLQTKRKKRPRKPSE